MPDINVNKLSEALNTKADIDLNNTGVFSTSGGLVNLTSSTPANASGKEVTSADFFQSNLLNYTTNRILEIPQDIKLELNNGTLTLKAGSKVYVPNGFEADGTTPKFDVVVIENDIHAGGKLDSFTDKWIFGYRNNGFYWELLSHCFSGSTLPTQTGENRLGYNTTLNKFQGSINGGAYIDDICSFPICIFSTNSGIITSIDQVFNGLGYIGSTVFVLPGVKVQAPIGRNADGTCTNLVHTVSSVFTYEAGHWNNATLYFLLGANACEGQDVRRFTRNKEFSSQPVTYSFDENENKWYYSNNSQAWNDSGFVLNIVGKFVLTSGKITSFEPFTVDSVVNSNASNFSQAGRSYLSSLGMPSDRYIDLTLGASGSTYTAPANGWFSWVFICGNTGGYVNAYAYEGVGFMDDIAANHAIKFYLPALKGDTIEFNYPSANTSSSDLHFQFFYAEGEN